MITVLQPPGKASLYHASCDTLESMRISDFPDRKALVRIVIDFCRLRYKDEHFHAVQLACSSALEHFRGIYSLCLDKNAIPAKALSRVLLENLVTAVVLAKHPEKLRDFKDCGRYLHLRSMRLSDTDIHPELNTRVSTLLSKHGRDYPQLEKRFGSKQWYGMTRREALKEAGFNHDPSDMYDTFFRPTSDFIHSDPSRFLMMNLNDEWIFGRSDKKEAVYLLGAYASSTSLLLTGMEQINLAFDLEFGDRLAAFKEDFFEFVPKYRAAALKLVAPPGTLAN
jgi:hypothetical protein